MVGQSWNTKVKREEENEEAKTESTAEKRKLIFLPKKKKVYDEDTWENLESTTIEIFEKDEVEEGEDG